jgi:(2Fe-2S) ferredoxin
MDKPKHHILLCASFRADGETKGMCNKKGSANLFPYVENEILDRGLDALISSTGCMKACDYGPVMVVYPEGFWYGNVDSEDVIDEILDALEQGKAADSLLLE